jgi:hypothetical protein
MNSGFLAYDPLRRYIAEYFGNPIMYKVSSSVVSGKNLKVYAINVSENVASQRYLMATSEKDGPDLLHLSDIDWNTFQTRTGNEYQHLPSITYEQPLQTPLRENILLSEVDDDRSIYKTDKFSCNIIVKTGSQSFRNIRTFTSALETFRCLVMKY